MESRKNKFVVEDNRSIIKKLAFKEKFGYALGDAGCAFAMTTINTYLMYFYTDIFEISISSVGVLFLIARIWDAINDPIIGGLIDKSNFKRNKYKSLLLYGSVPLAVFSVLCFTAPRLPEIGKLIYAYITYIGVGMLYTLVNTSYSSLGSIMTDDPVDRTSLTAVRMYVANIGNILLSVGVPMIAVYLGKESLGVGYRRAAMIFAGISVIFFIITYATTSERVKVKQSEEKVTFKETFKAIIKNKPLVILCLVFVIVFNNVTISTSVGMYYIKYNANREELASIFILLTSLPGLISLGIIPYFVNKVGKKKLLIYGTIISMIGLGILFIVPPYSLTLVFIARFISGFGATLIMGLIWNMIPDSIDYGEYITGKRLGAVTYAAIGFFFKLGTALAGIIPGFILDRAGYVPNVVQSPSALEGIKITLILVPFILYAVSLVPMFLYKLDEKECIRIAEVLRERRENS